MPIIRKIKDFISNQLSDKSEIEGEIKVINDPALLKKWKNGDIGSLSLMNFKSYMKFISFDMFKELYLNNSDEYRKFSTALMGDNREHYKKIFGERLGTYKGEFLHHVWILEFSGYNFIVLTAAGKGTGIEVLDVDLDNKPDEKIIWDFSRAFHEKVKF